MKLFIAFGFVCLFVVYSISNRIFLYLEQPYMSSTTQFGLEVLQNSTKMLAKYTLIFDHYAIELKKRAIITKRELYDTVYKDWRDFVDKLLKVAEDWRFISFDNRVITEKTKLLNDSVKKMLTPNKEESKDKFNRRFRVSIPNYIKEYKELLSSWMKLRKLYLKVNHENNILINEANVQITSYKELIAENSKEWTLSEKAVNYLIPGLLVIGPAVLTLGPVLGGMIGTVGPLSTAVYHLLDTYKYKPNNDINYNDIQKRFHSSGDVLEKLGSFIADNIASITITIEKIEKIETSLELLDSDILRDEFLEVLLTGVDGLSSYNDNIITKHMFINN
jgi:hypothetical protein